MKDSSFSYLSLLSQPPEPALLQQAHHEQTRLELSSLEQHQTWLVGLKQQSAAHQASLQQLRRSHYTNTHSLKRPQLSEIDERLSKWSSSRKKANFASSVAVKQEQAEGENVEVGSGRRAARNSAKKTSEQYSMTVEQATGTSTTGRGRKEKVVKEKSTPNSKSRSALPTPPHPSPVTPQQAQGRPFQPLTPSTSSFAPPPSGSSSGSPFRTPLPCSHATQGPPSTTTPISHPHPHPHHTSSPATTPSALPPALPLTRSPPSATKFPILHTPGPLPPGVLLFPGLLFVSPTQFSEKKAPRKRKAPKKKAMPSKRVRWQEPEEVDQGGGKSESTREVELAALST